MIDSAPPSTTLIESLNKTSLNRSRTIVSTASELTSDYALTKPKTACLSSTTPSLSSESSLVVVESNRLSGSSSLSSSSSGSSASNKEPTTSLLTSGTNTPRLVKTSNLISNITTHTSHRVHSNPNKLTKFRIQCKSSNYNSKEIANNLYEIDDHLNKDLIYDYFFNDNYMLDNNCSLNAATSAYSNFNTFKENTYSNSNYGNNSNVNITSQPWTLHRADTNSNTLNSNSTITNTSNANNTSSANTSNYNSIANSNNSSNINNPNNSTNSNSNNSNSNINNSNKLYVFWENSTNKMLHFNDWNDGFNEWYPMPPYPPLKTYINSLHKRRGAKQRTEIEFDEQLGLYLPTFKLIQKQLAQQQIQQQQQQEQIQQMQQKSISTYAQHASSYSQNHPSTRLIKELHKLVTNNHTNTTLVKFDENNIPTFQPTNVTLVANPNSNNIVNKKEFQLQQQFIYVNSIVNEQRQKQQQELQQQNQRQPTSANMKRTLQVRAAFPSLMNSSNSNSQTNANNSLDNGASPNTLLATQLLQLRSDEIDRLNTAQSNRNQNGNAVQIPLQSGHTSLSASSLVKQNSLPSSQTINNHSSSTNSMNKMVPLIINDDMNLIQIKKITQQQSEPTPSQDNISKQLVIGNSAAVQQHLHQARKTEDNNPNNSRNSSKQPTQIISVSSNQNGSTNNLATNANTTIGSPNAKVLKAAQPTSTAATTAISPPSSNTSSAGSMSSSSQSVSNNNNSNGNNVNSNPSNAANNTIIHSAYANDPRYRFKHDDESSNLNENYYSKPSKKSQPKSYNNTKYQNANISSNSTSSVTNYNNSLNSKKNDSIINPFFLNNQSDSQQITNQNILINATEIIMSVQQQHQQQQQQQQQQLVEKHLNNVSTVATATTTTTSSLPPIISGKRINLPLGPHRYL